VEAIMAHIDANRLGIVGAVLMAGWHLIWLVLQAAGQGQRVMDFVFRIHGLESDVAVQPFDLGMALVLVAVTALTGYGVAGLAGLVWNGVAGLHFKGRSGVASRA
jgi:hypothetical protein